MSYAVAFSPEALDQLDAIEQYIAETGSPITAARYVDAIVSFCEELTQFPLRSRQRDDLMMNLRITNYRGNAIIAYLVSDASHVVTVVGVFYGGQNYDSIFQEQPPE